MEVLLVVTLVKSYMGNARCHAEHVKQQNNQVKVCLSMTVIETAQVVQMEWID